MFPPSPAFTESNLPDLQGKVYIVTGASAGVGKELARLLYSRNGTVYVAARSSEKAQAAITWIREAHPGSQGVLHFLKLDLNDLEGIKPSAEEFLSKEKRLDVLFNNAGVMIPPQGSKTKQGYELQLGTNCIAPFLFTKLLTPLLISTAKSSPRGSVRVIWVLRILVRPRVALICRTWITRRIRARARSMLRVKAVMSFMRLSSRGGIRRRALLVWYVCFFLLVLYYCCC
jgi:retinol dehydrogenase-12